MAIINPYVSLDLVKKSLRITDNIDDDILELSIGAASREIDGYCERVFYSTTETRVFVPRDPFTVEIDDATSITEVKTASDGESFDTTFTTSDFQEEPLNGQAGGILSPTTRLRAVGDFLFPTFQPRNVSKHEATVRVSATFGFTPVPVAIQQAALLLTLRQYKRYESPLGVAGFDAMGAVRVGRIDPDVQKLIDPFRRLRMG